MIGFLHDLENVAHNVYEINDIEKLNADLQKLNEAYDTLISKDNITDMEREYVLSKYVKHTQVNMFTVPLIHDLSKIMRLKYNQYHRVESSLEIPTL